MSETKFNKLIKFPENKINTDAFFNKRYLENISALDSYSFSNNDSLSAMFIPNYVSKIGENAFVNSSNAVLYIDQKRDTSPLFPQSFNWGLDVDRIYFIKDREQVFYNELDNNTYYYKYDNSIKGIKITGTPMIDSISVISLPTTINGFPIKIIDKFAFRNCTNLCSVTLPDGIEILEEQCFCFTNISSITIPSTVTDICEYAFAECSALTNIYLSGVRDSNKDIYREFKKTNDGNGDGWNNLFRGNLPVPVFYVNCNISNLADSAFFSSNISCIEYCWTNDDGNVEYQTTTTLPNYGKNIYPLFGNYIYNIINAFSSQSFNYWSNVCQTLSTSFILEIKPSNNDLESYISYISKLDNGTNPNNLSAVLPFKFESNEHEIDCNVKLLYACTINNSEIDSVQSLFYNYGGRQHSVVILPCFATVFFGKFIGFGKFALHDYRAAITNESNTKNLPIRICLSIIDDDDTYLNSLNNAKLSRALKIQQIDFSTANHLTIIFVDIRIFDDLTCFGSEIYESYAPCLMFTINSLMNRNCNFDIDGSDFLKGITGSTANSDDWFKDWHDIILSPHFKENVIAGELGGDADSFDLLFAQKYFQQPLSINDADNTTINFGELVWIGPASKSWPSYNVNTNNINLKYTVRIKNELASTEINARYVDAAGGNLTSNNIPLSIFINSSDLSALGNYAFSGNNGISSITFEPTLDSNLTNITQFKENVFRSVSNLRYINGLSLLTNLDTILSACFFHAISLLSIDLGNSIISSLEPWTFRQCNSLTTIYLPTTLTKIADGTVFAETPALCNIYFGNENELSNDNFMVSSDNTYTYLLEHKDGIPQSFMTMIRKSNTTEKIMFNYQNINVVDYAFWLNSTISGVVIYESNIIGKSAFEGASNITDIEIKNGSTLGINCFKDIPTLASLIIEDNISIINSFEDSINKQRFVHLLDVFSRNTFSNLHNLTISNNSDIRYIPAHLCENNTSLTSMYLPNSIKYIGNSAFKGCQNLNNINLDNSTVLISIDDYAFKNCTSLTSIILPDSILNIGNGVFDGCSNLSSIVIPSSVKYIGPYTFANIANETKKLSVQIDMTESESKTLFEDVFYYIDENGEIITKSDFEITYLQNEESVFE